MRLEKAIKKLEKEIPPIPRNEWSEDTQAKALGIEALRRVSAYDDLCKIGGRVLLPGETKE